MGKYIDEKDVKRISKAYDALYDVGHRDNGYYRKMTDAIEKKMSRFGYAPVLNQRTQRFSFKKIVK